jgi:RimJ/RimL family protein N-acetyltransferase
MTGLGLGHSIEDEFILTARLALRRPEMRDAAAVAMLANDRVIAENTAQIPYPYKPEHAEAWISSVEEGAAGRVWLAFLEPEDGAPVLVGCGGFGHRGSPAAPEVGYWIGAPFRGQGYATEITRALVDIAFEHCGEERLTAECRVTNGASRRVLEKCGFQWAGCGLTSSVGFRGSFPVDRFRFDRGVWASLKAWQASTLCPSARRPREAAEARP